METTKCPSTDAQMRKVGCSRAAWCCSALGRGEAMASALPWLHLENTVLSERSLFG